MAISAAVSQAASLDPFADLCALFLLFCRFTYCALARWRGARSWSALTRMIFPLYDDMKNGASIFYFFFLSLQKGGTNVKDLERHKRRGIIFEIFIFKEEEVGKRLEKRMEAPMTFSRSSVRFNQAQPLFRCCRLWLGASLPIRVSLVNSAHARTHGPSVYRCIAHIRLINR